MYTGFPLRLEGMRKIELYNRVMFRNRRGNIKPPKNNQLIPIWKYFQENGYISAQIDNSCQDWESKYIGRSSHGWDHQFVAPFCLPEYFPLQSPHSVWTGPFSIRRRCLHGRHAHQWYFLHLVLLFYSILFLYYTRVLEYFHQFWKTYSDVPKFAITAFTEGHEGTSEVIGLLDPDIADLLSSPSLLNDTVIFIGKS